MHGMSDRTEPQTQPTPSRRDFLKLGAGTAGAATALVVASGGEAQTLEPPLEQVKSRYSRTPHVERFYFLNSL